MRIRIQKIGVVPTGLPANPINKHIDGQIQDEGHSLPIEYTIEGELWGKIEVGKSVIVARNMRNGIRMPGTFFTTPVTEITPNQFKTQNSVYNYKFLENPTNN